MVADGNRRIGALIIDILETWAGDWFTEQQIVTMSTSLRPGLDVPSVERALRRLKVQGWGKAHDRVIVCTSSGKRLRRCRKVTVEVKPFAEDSALLRVPFRNYWQ